MNNKIPELFRTIAGREPTKEELQRLMASAQIIGLRNDDAMLLLLATLEVYNGMYSRAPAMIAATIKQAEGNARETADSAIRTATANMLPTLTQTLKDASRQTIVNLQIKQAGLIVMLASLAIALVFFIGFLSGSTVLASFGSGQRADLFKMVVSQGWAAAGLVACIPFFCWVYQQAEHWVLQSGAIALICAGVGGLVYKFVM
jgi:hypothetical protein